MIWDLESLERVVDLHKALSNQTCSEDAQREMEGDFECSR